MTQLATVSKDQPAAADGTLVIDIHALHKSATMFLFHFFDYLAPRVGLQLLSENHDPPHDYQLDLAKLAESQASIQGVCRCPVRTFELDELRAAEGTDQRRVYHVRDPRDILVSEYFSFGWIHSTSDTPLSDRRIEIQQMSIDDYVLRQSQECSWPLEAKFAPLLEHELDPEREVVVRYEDMVTRFPKWCRQVLSVLPVRRPGWLTRKLAWRYRNEFRSRGEQLQHKRRITPGDYFEKCSDLKDISVFKGLRRSGKKGETVRSGFDTGIRLAIADKGRSIPVWIVNYLSEDAGPGVRLSGPTFGRGRGSESFRGIQHHDLMETCHFPLGGRTFGRGRGHAQLPPPQTDVWPWEVMDIT